LPRKLIRVRCHTATPPDACLLPYEAVRSADDPDHAVARFLQTTYEAAAELGGWDRSTLEDDPDRLLPLSIRRT
jgi:hypothetical protein